MMKQLVFRKWHRYVGVTVMPLFVAQVISSFVLSLVDSLGLVERTPQATPVGIAILVIRKLPALMSPYDELMMALHFSGGSLLGGILRALTTIALLWVMFSGMYIFLSTRSLKKRRH